MAAAGVLPGKGRRSSQQAHQQQGKEGKVAAKREALSVRVVVAAAAAAAAAALERKRRKRSVDSNECRPAV